MNNCIVINGKTIELTDAQVAEIKKNLGPQYRLCSVAVGEVAYIAGIPFVVLEHSKDTTAVITRDLYITSVKFGNTNDFVGSDVLENLLEFHKKIRDFIGARNIVQHTVDLISEDGLKDYGKAKMMCSLLTCDLYRRYVSILDRYKVNGWWWLCTPHSTKQHHNDMHTKAVGPSGFISNVFCEEKDECGLRPFLILSSDTPVD